MSEFIKENHIVLAFNEILVFPCDSQQPGIKRQVSVVERHTPGQKGWDVFQAKAI